MSRIIDSAGRLKPEARLGKAISDFRAALENEQQLRFDTLKAEGPPKPADAIKLAEEINAKGQKVHSSWKPYGTHAQKALGIIQALAAAGDIMVGGSQNLIASGAWAVVRVALTWSVSYLSLFEKISDKLTRVGRSASIRQEMVGLFPRDAVLREMVLEYLIIVVEMSRSFVDFRNAGQLTRYVAAFSMNKDLKDYEDRLAVWAGLINEQVQFLHSQVSVEVKKTATLISKSQDIFSSTWKKEKDHVRCAELMKYLAPDQDEFDRAWRRHRKKGTVKWVFEHEDFLWWVSDQKSFKYEFPPGRARQLLIEGSMGKGKTVLMANIVSHLIASEDAGIVAAVFCERANVKTLDADNVIASIAQQILKAILAGYVKAGSARIPESLVAADQTRHPKQLATLVRKAVDEAAGDLGSRYWKPFIVLDGLGLMPGSELKEVSAFVRTLVDDHPKTRVCISVRSGSSAVQLTAGGREGGVAEIKTKVLHLGNPAFDIELSECVRRELSSRPGFQALGAAVQDLISQTITDLAGGIHIWASLQIDHLFPLRSGSMPTEKDIVGLMSHLPGPLHELFDAALLSITDSRHQPIIFQLVIAAKRPLTVPEILIALSVKLKEDILPYDWSEDDIPHWYDHAAVIYECSGGLLELDNEEETVHFVHDSVYYHLTDRQKDWTSFLNIVPAVPPGITAWKLSHVSSDLHLGRVCLKYLDLPIHQRQLTQTNEAQQRFDYSKAVINVTDSLAYESPIIKVAGRAMKYISGGTRASVSVNLAKVAEAYLQDRRKNRGNESQATALLKYASAHWLEHSDHWLWDDVDSTTSYKDQLHGRFHKVLFGQCAATREVPSELRAILNYSGDNDPWAATVAGREVHGSGHFEKTLLDALRWVIQHDHFRLFWTVMDTLTRLVGSFPIASLPEMFKNVKFQLKKGKDDIVWARAPQVPADLDVLFFNVQQVHDELLVSFQAVDYFNCYLELNGNYTLAKQFIILLQYERFMVERRVETRMGRAIARLEIPVLTQITLDESRLPGHGSWLEPTRLHQPYTIMELPGLVQFIVFGEVSKLWTRAAHFRPVLTDWWLLEDYGSVSSFPSSIEETRHVIFALHAAGVPCHLRSEKGMTPLRWGLNQEAHIPHLYSWYQSCGDCLASDHPTGTLGHLVKKRSIGAVKAYCSRGPVYNNDIFDPDDRTFRLGDHPGFVIRGNVSGYDRYLEQDAQHMVQALRGAGAQVEWRWSWGDSGVKSTIEIRERLGTGIPMMKQVYSMMEQAIVTTDTTSSRIKQISLDSDKTGVGADGDLDDGVEDASIVDEDQEMDRSTGHKQ